jgi:hypothetical protein
MSKEKRIDPRRAFLAQAQSPGDGGGHEPRGAHAGQRYKCCPIAEARSEHRSDPHRNTRLADASNSGQCEEANVRELEEANHLPDFAISADKWSSFAWKAQEKLSLGLLPRWPSTASTGLVQRSARLRREVEGIG